MTFANEGDWDRAVRMLAGILLMYAGSGGFVMGSWSVALAAIGALSFITAIAGWCPAYSLFGFTTPPARTSTGMNACAAGASGG